jgi:beta-phosphoglucomutase family hydrolase
MLGLPDGVAACLFDMDGVVTQTAVVHAAAWKEMFDEFLRTRAKSTGTEFVPFNSHEYDDYVDGRPRLDGTKSFLESRGIELPEGTPDDAPGKPTLYGLSNRKNDLVLAKIANGGVKVYDGTIRYIHAVREKGIHTAIVSASANTVQVLKVAGIADLFDVRVDGVVAKERGLRGKPAPDTFLAAAQELKVPPGHAVVFEDAQSGVAAGHAGHFALVVGVDRVGQAEQLKQHGADVVVKDVADLLDQNGPDQNGPDQNGPDQNGPDQNGPDKDAR